MPSGAKKRKAAKKKQEKQASNNNNNAPNTHLGDLQEEKESDGGETNSPMSQDHNNNQHFSEEREDTSSIQSAVTESDSVEGVNGNGDSSENVAFEEKSTLKKNPDTVTIEHTEYEKKSSSSSSSSRSSSDDESKFADKNIQVINWEETIYSPSLPAEADAIIYSEEIPDLSEVSRVNEVALHNLDVVTPTEESYEAVPVLDDDFVGKKSKVEVSNSVAETIPQVEPVVMPKEVGKSEDLGVPSTVVDMGSQSNGDAISTKATENGEVIMIPIKEVLSKTVPQSSVPAVDTVNGTEQNKVSEIESLDRQTPVVQPPRPVQTTSSMGCCGLFELFKGSNR